MEPQLGAQSGAPTPALDSACSALSDSERFGLLVDGVSDRALITLDPDGRVADWNRGAEAMTGYAASDIVGQHYSVFYVPEDIAAGVPARQLRSAATDGRLGAEGWQVRQDASRYWADVVITPLGGGPEVVRGYAVITSDITERRERGQAQRKAATELAVANAVLRRQATELIRSADLANQAARDAEAASRAKSAFLATMSHELRTPMNGLVGMAELLLTSELNEEQTKFATTVDACARSLLAIIKDVLDFAELENGNMHLALSDVDLRATIDDCATLLAPSAHAKGLEFSVDIAADTPAAARGDASRVRQVLANLIGNAIKFTPHGAVVVRARTEYDDHGARVVLIETVDTGIGIAADAQERVFASFTQLDSTSSREYGGSGLGLSLAKQLVELMAGEIGVDSAPGAGSTFWFTLPVGEGSGTES
jgi:PAS domain S-box-containing protein